ncbi:UDP-N-acetylmuramoyl-L-alanine--D-glutamate ligase [Lacisediminihabitans changchengi]|uniref:UDP-N-acetylmuramoylalanine--D-glutamate ligase n=1 Tax=Lacisediminihabitans changchengi TaxID=2787634 RepID=A0A934SLW6_9MICO|nr:UDP-N-acetylmuramoyl-L-alanine--D-glutamate ligase [Lacisediminihabitans changchengi]MBK4347755.1 UDP-N-acetylmuramoyl-L-alanine--D-glutamate ligase [Lacisediminihabitans changchengi]
MTRRTPAAVAQLVSWNAEWRGLRVAVLGLGVTGFSVADTLAELGAEVLVIAERADVEFTRILDVLGVRWVQSDLERELVDFEPELVVVSPGFRPDHPLVVAAESTGAPLWGDVELAWRLRDKVTNPETGKPAEWIAITGTNGKTTTTQLTTAMIAEAGGRVVACGNVGVPVLDAIRDPLGWDVLVVELSSFQLHYLDSMSAWSAVCLNIAEDHLDWHGSAEAYRAAKGKVYQNAQAICLYNLADEATRELVEDAEVVEGCRAVGFGLGAPGPSDLGIIDGILIDRAFHDDRHHTALEITTVHDLVASGLASPHMTANVLAAAALARSAGVTIEQIRAALAAFRLDAHRTETIVEADGIRWVDDSKATNPHAAQAALSAFPSIVWVVGGLFKGVDVDALVAANVRRLRAAVVIGTDRQPVIEAFTRHAPELPVFEVATTDTEEVMPSAVRLAARVARAGDTVLLAPAAASMDQFTDYADRGVRFAEAVRRLGTAGTATGGTTDDDEHSAPPTDA